MKLKFPYILFILTFCNTSSIQNETTFGVKITNLEYDLQETKTNILDMLKTVEKISQKYETVANTLETAIINMDRKLEHLKQDILDKLESKVKREQRGKFVTQATFDVISQKIKTLEGLPKNLSKAVSRTYHDITEDITQSTITKDEFASFQLLVARDTCHIRVSKKIILPTAT